MHPDSTGYRLTLADGTKWFLTSEPEMRPWLDELARILRLKPGQPQDARQLVFRDLRRADSGPAESENLGSTDRIVCPTGGADTSNATGEVWDWSHPRSSLYVRRSSDDRHVVCSFPIEETEQADIRLLHMWKALGVVHLQAILNGGLPFHATLAELDGRGILFAGASGMGKSTCSQRLPPPWKSWCDDVVLVARHPQNGYRAHPFPTWTDHLWRGLNNTWPAEHHLALSAIFFLDQAPEDSVTPLGTGENVARTCQSVAQIMRTHWKGMEREPRRQVTTKVFDNACAMARTIPAFRLRLTLDGRFWEEVEKALRAAANARGTNH